MRAGGDWVIERGFKSSDAVDQPELYMEAYVRWHIEFVARKCIFLVSLINM